MPHTTYDIRAFLLDQVRRGSTDVVARGQERFQLSRQAISYHLRQLTDMGILRTEGATKSRRYVLSWPRGVDLSLPLNGRVTEDGVWTRHVAPLLMDAPANTRAICQYGVSEMVNNVIDHANGSTLTLHVHIHPDTIHLHIIDDGVGIFRKIKDSLGLEFERHALLELAKGKFTTDPTTHSGQGIFFTSRLFDEFGIRSGDLFFSHHAPADDWLLDETYLHPHEPMPGTMVTLTLAWASDRTLESVFNRFAGPEDYTFSSTHVPLRLAQYGDELLISRSQAKRVLTRFDRFREVMLDFNGVATIGQAFADEIFRVFTQSHPNVRLRTINTSPQVEQMIRRATGGSTDYTPSLFDDERR